MSEKSERKRLHKLAVEQGQVAPAPRPHFGQSWAQAAAEEVKQREYIAKQAEESVKRYHDGRPSASEVVHPSMPRRALNGPLSLAQLTSMLRVDPPKR